MRRHLILTIVVGLIVVFALIAIQPYIKPAPKKTSITQFVTNNQFRTAVVVRKQFFSWKELESADYPTYIKNLRDIGCPEPTIRDIIIAEINLLYARKRADEISTPQEQWWRTDSSRDLADANGEKLAALDAERRTLLTSLLGPGWDASDPLTQPIVSLSGAYLGELPPETKTAVENIVSRYQQLTQNYLTGQKSAGAPVNQLDLAKLSLQMRGELGQYLSAAQMEEFLLRYADTSADLRGKLQGVNVTPEEFKRLFRFYDPLEQTAQSASADAATLASQQTNIDSQLNNAIKSVLGPDRFQTYNYFQDPIYRDAVTQVQEAGAAPDAVQKLYRINSGAVQEENRIRNDPTLTVEQKTAQLNALDDQTQTATERALGLSTAETQPIPPPLPQIPLQVHPYSPGETIDQIAAQYNVTPIAILSANPNLDFNGLSKGTGINIPKRQP